MHTACIRMHKRAAIGYFGPELAHQPMEAAEMYD